MGLWRSTWWLIAARWRIAYNTFMRGARWRRFTYVLVAGALAFLTLISAAVSYGMSRVIVSISRQPELADVIVGTTLNGGLVLSVLVGFTVALGALYLSSDLDLLLSAPVPRRAVFNSKLVAGLLPTQMVVLAITVVPIIGHGLAMDYDRPFYLALIAAVLLLPLLPTAVGAIAVMLIVRRVPAHRLGEVVGLLVVAMTLTIALVAGSARELQAALTLRDLVGLLERLRSPLSPAEWLTRGLAATGRHEFRLALKWFGLTTGVSAAAMALLALLSERLYYEGWMHMRSADRGGQAAGGRMPWSRVDRAEQLSRPAGLLAVLSAPAAAVIQKDFRVIPRDLTNMAQVLSPLSIGVFFILQQLLYPIRIGGTDRPQPFAVPLLAMLSAAIAGGVSAMIMARFGLTAFSMEGKGYWAIKSSPISRRELLTAKFLVAYLPYLGLACGLVVLLEIARSVSDARLAGGPLLAALVASFRPGLLLYSWFVVAVVGLGTIAITLALGSAKPNLRWDTPHEMLTPDVGCLSLVLYGAYGLVTVLSLAIPAAVSGFPMLGQAGLLWVLGLAIGLGATAVVVVGSLVLAHGELDAVGE